VSRPTVRDWHYRAKHGTLKAGTPGPTGPRKLTQADDRLLREQVALRPGITARELASMLSVSVTVATVCRRLIQLDLRLKKRR
jgi:transposase